MSSSADRGRVGQLCRSFAVRGRVGQLCCLLLCVVGSVSFVVFCCAWQGRSALSSSAVRSSVGQLCRSSAVRGRVGQLCRILLCMVGSISFVVFC